MEKVEKQNTRFRVIDKKTNKEIKNVFMTNYGDIVIQDKPTEILSQKDYVIQHATPYPDKNNNLIIEGDICFNQRLECYGTIIKIRNIHRFLSAKYDLLLVECHSDLIVIDDKSFIIENHIKQQNQLFYKKLLSETKEYIVSKAFHMVVWDEIVYYFEELRDHIDWTEQDVKAFQKHGVIFDIHDRVTRVYEIPSSDTIEKTYQIILAEYDNNN